MGIERAGLDIIIQTPGSEQAAQNIDRVADATKRLGESTSHAGDAADAFIEHTKKATAAQEGMGQAVESAAEATPAMTAQVGLLSGALGIAGPLLFGLVKGVFDYVRSVEALARTSLVHENVSKSMLMLGGSARDAAEGLAAFNLQLAEGADAARDYADQLGRVEEAIKKADQRAAAGRDAKEGLAIARVNAAEKEGRLTPDRAIAARLEITNFYEDRREQARQKAEAEKIEAKGEAIRKTQEQRIRAEAELPGAMKQAAEDERAAEAAPHKLKSDLTDIEERLKEARELKEDLLGQRGGYQMLMLEGAAKLAPEGSAAAKAPGSMREQIDTQIDEADQQIGQLEQLRYLAEKAPGRAAKKADKSAKRVGDLEGIIEKSRATEGTLFEDIVSGKQAHETDTRSRREVQGIQRETRGVDADIKIKESLRRQEEERLKQEEREARELEREQKQQEREINRQLFQRPRRGGASLEIETPDSQQVQQAAGRVVKAIQENNAVILAAFSRIETILNGQGGNITTLFSRNSISRIV